MKTSRGQWPLDLRGAQCTSELQYLRLGPWSLVPRMTIPGELPPPRPGHLDQGAVAGDKDAGAAEVGKVGAGAPARNDTVDGGPQRRTSDAIPVGEASRLAP